jgi:parvulin-like peptidyl-prolyl isomerase
MIGEVELVAFSLGTGEISEVVESRYGFHVITVTERSEGRQRSFEDVARQVKSKLAAERLQRDVDAQFAWLREAADVRVYDDVVAGIEVPDVAAGEYAGFHGL